MKISITVDGLSIDEALVFLAANENVNQPAEKLAEAVTEAKAEVKSRERIPPTPAVAKLIDEAGADWVDIKGSGKDGRITQQDARAYLRRAQGEKRASLTGSELVDPGSENSGDTPTLDDAREALKALNGSKGMPACLELLAKFGAKRIGDLKPADYPAFTAAAV